MKKKFSCCSLWVVSTWLFVCVHSFAATPPENSEAKYAPEPGMIDLIQRACDKDRSSAKRAVAQLVGQGAVAERAINYLLLKETTTAGRVRYADLWARCNFGRVGYRVILELHPDGTGNVTLGSDRTLIAECCKRNAQIKHEPEVVFTQEDLSKNLFSKVNLMKHMVDNISYLEGRVETRQSRIEAQGSLNFTQFDAFKSFADSFDAGGYHLIGGTTLTDRRGLRTLRYKRPREEDVETFQKNMLLYHTVRWEYILDFKGKVGANNATQTDGTKLIWSFNCSQMLKGEAIVEVNYKNDGLRLRASTDENFVLDVSSQDHLPVAVVEQREFSVRTYNRAPSAPQMTAKELHEKGYLVELDGRNSTPCPTQTAHVSHTDEPSTKTTALQFLWTQISGEDLKLKDEDLRKEHLAFTIKLAGEYHFTLTVTSEGVASNPVEVVIVATSDVAAVEPKKVDRPVVATPVASKDVDTPLIVIEKAPVAPLPPVVKVEATTPKPNDTITTVPSIPTNPTVVTAPVLPVKPKDNESVKVPIPSTPTVLTPPVSPSVDAADASKIKVLYEAGLKQFKAGDYAGARSCLETVCKASPDDPECKFDLGMALMELAEYKAAIKQFESVTDSKSPRCANAFMNIGHCFSRQNLMGEVLPYYRKGNALNASIYWESQWQQGSILLEKKHYERALFNLLEAEKKADAVKVKDFRLYRDLAVASHETGKNAEALKYLESLTALGYTPDPQLLANVKANKLPTPNTPDVVKPNVSKGVVDAPKVDAPKVTPVPEPHPASKDTHATETSVSLGSSVPPTPSKVESTPKNALPDPRATGVTQGTKPSKSHKQDKRVRPVVPKRPLPPIPTEFSDALASGKKALTEGEQRLESIQKDKTLTPEKIEETRILAAQCFDEAEAMFRAAWAQKPSDPAVLEAFDNVAKHSGAIALAKNLYITAKVRGLIILDAEPSIAPIDKKTGKPKPLYYSWEQSDGDELDLRTEEMAYKKVKVRIPKAGIYKFDLAVSDGAKGGNPVTVTVEVVE